MARPSSPNFDTSVENLDHLLADVVASPSVFANDVELLQALTSQGALARFSRPERSIVPLSLNTLKGKSDALLAYGFSGLDAERRRARQAVDTARRRASRAGKRTKEAIAMENMELRAEINEQRKEMANLSGAFYESIRYGRICAKESNNPAASNQYEKHIIELLSRFSLPKERRG